MKTLAQSKEGKSMSWTPIVIILLVIGAAWAYKTGFFQQTAGPGGGTPGAPSTVGCPDTLTWAGTVNLQNQLNRTGVEMYNATAYFYRPDGSLRATTTSTAPGSVTLTCGESYTVKLISTSGAAGDDSFMTSSDATGAQSDGNGNIIFTASGPGSTVTFVGKQHGLWETRAYSVIDNAFMFNASTGATSGTPYIPSNIVNFTGPAVNSTGFAVGSGGEFHVKQYVRAQVDDQDVNDRGVYILIDAATTAWQTPTVKIAGVVATNMKSSLNPDEAAAYSNYEYVYKVDQSRQITLQNELEVDISMFAQSGINPTAANNVLVDYAPIGQYLSTQTSNSLKVGSVQDDSAKTVVHTLQQTIYTIS